MHIGIVFPQTEIGTDPGAIRTFAEAAEELGFDHISGIDHVLGAREPHGPPWARFYTVDRQFHEPLVLFGYLSAVTRRIGFATAILILSQRQTALVAKQAAEVDVLSGGRMRLGIGIGWNALEFEALGTNFHDRGARVGEQVDLLRRLWTERTIDFEGRWHRVRDAGINPLPVQRPIPVWFGAFVDVAIRRAARIGDGLFLNPRLKPGPDAADEMARIAGHVRDAGRDPAAFGTNATIHAAAGGPETWGEHTAWWREQGATHATFRTIDAGYETLDRHLEAMRRYAADNLDR